MKKIIIVGAGAMGSAFTVPCVDNNNEVTLVGTHLENELITGIKKNKNSIKSITKRIIHNFYEIFTTIK